MHFNHFILTTHLHVHSLIGDMPFASHLGQRREGQEIWNSNKLSHLPQAPNKDRTEAALPLVPKPHPALAPLCNASHQRIPCVGSGEERAGMLKGYANDQDSHTRLRVHTEFVTKITLISWLQKRAGILCVWNYGGEAEYDQTPPNQGLSLVCLLIPRRCEATGYRDIMWTAGF